MAVRRQSWKSRGAASMLGFVAAMGCSAEVIVVEDEQALDAQSELVTPASDPLDAGCTPCGGGDCGLCLGRAAFRCDSDQPTVAGCYAMPELFWDGESAYVCWTCE